MFSETNPWHQWLAGWLTFHRIPSRFGPFLSLSEPNRVLVFCLSDIKIVYWLLSVIANATNDNNDNVRGSRRRDFGQALILANPCFCPTLDFGQPSILANP